MFHVHFSLLNKHKDKEAVQEVAVADKGCGPDRRSYAAAEEVVLLRMSCLGKPK